jgi:hypothetical protein
VHRHDSHAVHRRDPAGRLGPPPGTPIGIAPVTYTLWQQFLRFDPSDPIWPNRDCYVLSSGHASTLLWSMLHLTRVRAVDPDYEVLGQPAVSLDDLSAGWLRAAIFEPLLAPLWAARALPRGRFSGCDSALVERDPELGDRPYRRGGRSTVVAYRSIAGWC